MAAVTKMERPILDVNQLGDLADYGLAEVTPEAVSAAYWDQRFSVIEGGLFEGLDISDLDEYTIEQKPWYKGAVDGVSGFLKGIHLPRLRGEPVEAAVAVVAPGESEEAGRNRFFGWLKEIDMKAGEWWQQLSSGKKEEEASVPAAAAPAAPEGEVDRFGWLKNGWKWLAGVPGGIVGKFRRQGETVVAPQVSREERVKALKEGTKQFAEQYGPEVVAGLLGIGLGWVTVGAESVAPDFIAGSWHLFSPFGRELGAMAVAAIAIAGRKIGDARGPESIPLAEKLYQRPVRALQRFCSQKAVRRGLSILASGGLGYSAGGAGRIAYEGTVGVLQLLGGDVGSVPAEAATGSLKNVWSPGVGTAPEVADWEARRQAVEQLTQSAGQLVTEPAIQDMVSQSEAAFTQASQALSAISSDLSGNSSVSPLVDSAQQALRTANQFYSDAMASGGIDATEAAKLQDLATQAQAAVDAAVNTANQIRQAAADATAATETARQATLQYGQVMKDVIAGTPSQTAFEALQQQVFQATGSPHSAEAANALSWSLPHGDITGLHTGAIGEAAKKVTDLISQAHDYAAGHGVSYTIHSIRQAVDAGQLTPDVLKAVEAANAPAGSDVKAAAQTGLNTILQTVVK